MNYRDDPFKRRGQFDPFDYYTRMSNLIDPNRKPQEQAQLAGCGDPDCSMCKPEVAAQRRQSGETGRPFSSGSSFGGGFPSSISTTSSDAYDAVEKWIVPAPDQSFEDIIGNEAALEQLRDAIEAPVKYAELYSAYGMKMPKGAMLCGPPGCGKTMFARAAASEMKRIYGSATEMLSISGSELQSMFVGETEKRIKDIFTYAREYKHKNGHPLLVFIDEAEVLLPDRTGRVRRVASWEESQVATFLAEMDGMQESGAFVLLATNRPEVIDQAVLRDGRFDFKVYIKRPNQEAVESIIRKALENLLLAEPVDNLVFAAVESIYDPHKILLTEKSIEVNFEERSISVKDTGHFCLEHIISGAMAVGIANRALRLAFSRDKATGKPLGIDTANVIAAVNAVFEENKELDHTFALQDFLKERAEND